MIPTIIRIPTLVSLLGRKKRKKKLVALPWPAGEQLHYGARLLEISREAASMVRTVIVPSLPYLLDQSTLYVPEPVRRADDAADVFRSLMERVRSLVSVSPERAAGLAIEMLERVQGQHGKRFVAAYDGVLAINPFIGAEPWLIEQMALRTQENIALIQSIPEDLLFDVETTVTRELLKGTHARDIASLLSERFDVSESRALLIATDQTGKWHGSLNKFRQLDAGVAEYEWLTMGDGAVRPEHRKLNHTRRKWGQGLEPGQAIRCRCQSIPVIPEE